VFVEKLTAVLNEESGETAPSPSGFSGRMPWTRWSRYTASRPARLKRSMVAAQVFQPISSWGRMPDTL
jgi:hypothetical protein